MLVALSVAALGMGDSSRVAEAVKYAKTVLLVKSVLQDDGQIHSYVKEVWRAGAEATPPLIGDEYGRTHPFNPRIRSKVQLSDMIVFEFGMDRPGGLPNSFRVSVTERGWVPSLPEEVSDFDDDGRVTRRSEEPMSMDAIRWAVKKTKPEKPTGT